MKPTKWKIATQAESLPHVNRIRSEYSVADASAVRLADGQADAVRVLLDDGTGAPLVNRDGHIRITAPWTLAS